MSLVTVRLFFLLVTSINFISVEKSQCLLKVVLRMTPASSRSLSSWNSGGGDGFLSLLGESVKRGILNSFNNRRSWIQTHHNSTILNLLTLWTRTIFQSNIRRGLCNKPVKVSLNLYLH